MSDGLVKMVYSLGRPLVGPKAGKFGALPILIQRAHRLCDGDIERPDYQALVFYPETALYERLA